ncbi:MAG: T9SS type A sorting domain-containing protein [Bacteroidetes bacterium]|nr:T9SS type A sorting domain-containing protein [Bacteroidota bacterium]MBS1975171.1 T9SS type A sorting domain-containing protein [Bacteroidota bacterium]
MKKHFKIFVLFFLLTPVFCTAQTTVNIYARVTAISGSTLTISNATAAFPTGQAILMQMKDSVVQTSTGNNSSFGNVDNIRNAGISELVTINSVSGTTITLSGAPKNSYYLSANSRVQLISYPTLGNNYTLNSSLTATAWDGNIGGVLAFKVTGTLTLNANLVVDGTGYRGGNAGANAPSDYSCDPNTYYDNAGGATTTYYGLKGESIHVVTNVYTVAKGKMAGGGGGGNLDNAGGGGGGNFTAGGGGGYGWTCTSSTNGGGNGGADLSNYISSSRFFMGSGGGGGQQNNNVGTAGGKGGGIIMISAATVQTKNGCSGGSITISANGANAANSGNDGSGGGGAGGTILIQAANYSINNGCPVNIQNNGGSGGTVQNAGSHGGGGGGGRGAVIFVPQASTPTNATVTSNSGAGGGNSNGGGATYAGGGSTTSVSGGTGIIYGTISPLPVTFISFTASQQNTAAVLYWTTTNEIKNERFEIEKSNNGTTYTSIGSVLAATNAANVHNYSFTDANPTQGNNYYRLKQIDLDGNYSYSQVYLLQFNAITGAGINMYPNPAGNHQSITLSVGKRYQQMTVKFLNTAGQVGFAQTFNNVNGSVSLNPDNLVTGIYFVEIIADNQILQPLKFVSK